MEAALCLKSFPHFVRRAWREIDPTPLQWNWHVDAVCGHLQAVAEGKIKNLIINIPPGHAKSMLVSVMFPCWMWAINPSWSSIFASYDIGLVTRDAVKSRDLMRSEWYRKYFSTAQSPFFDPTNEHRSYITPWDFAGDQDQKTRYKNTELGERTVVSVEGKSTGYRSNMLIVDDPMKVTDASNPNALDAVDTWWNNSMLSRLNDPKHAVKVVIMQRLHDSDLTARILAKNVENWQHLCLPSEFVPERRCRTYTEDGVLFFEDPRTEFGELLFPQMYDKSVIDKKKYLMTDDAYAAQYQQDPLPDTGGKIRKEFFARRWTDAPQITADLREMFGEEIQLLKRPSLHHFSEIAIFVDATFKKTDTSDLVAIGVFGKYNGMVYLLELVWRRMGFAETVEEIGRLDLKYYMHSGIYVEDKANGSAILETLKAVKVGGVIDPNKQRLDIHILKGSSQNKISRVEAAIIYLKRNTLVLPADAEWLQSYISEATRFPKARHDDAIDMTAYALLTLCNDIDHLDAYANSQLPSSPYQEAYDDLVAENETYTYYGFE